MADAADLLDELNRIIAQSEERARARLAAEDGDGAKRVITAAQKELRLLKRDVIDLEREVRQAYQDERLKVSGSGTTLGMFMGSKARGAMGRARASQKRSLQRSQADDLRPLAELKSEIDRVILLMDQNKTRITDAMAEEDPSSSGRAEAGPPPPPPMPPQWAPDPSGRHQFRYWDGARWTEHVADNGQAATDPL